MANRQRAEARRKAQSKISYGGGGEGGGSKLMIWLALAVVVLLAGGVAFFATKDDKTASAPPATDQAGNNIPVSQPVTITGDALVPFDNAATADAAVGEPRVNVVLCHVEKQRRHAGGESGLAA